VLGHEYGVSRTHNADATTDLVVVLCRFAANAVFRPGQSSVEPAQAVLTALQGHAKLG
jgi:hypothetical protein